MVQSRQKAYLDAMGIPVWVLRDGNASSHETLDVQLGPGSGQVLLLSSTLNESAGRLAADIARSLRSEPVWGWPATDEPGLNLQDAVKERLLTHIVVFGTDAAAQMIDRSASELLGSAIVVRAPSLSDLKTSVAERRKFWSILCQHRLAGPRGRPGRA